MSNETLTEWLLRQVGVDQDGLTRTYSDLAEALRGQGMPTSAVWMTEQCARVLAACDAKRRIIVRCSETQLSRSEEAVHLANQTLRDLAREYAARPGYETWRE